MQSEKIENILDFYDFINTVRVLKPVNGEKKRTVVINSRSKIFQVQKIEEKSLGKSNLVLEIVE